MSAMVSTFCWVMGMQIARCSTPTEVLLSLFLMRSMVFVSRERKRSAISRTHLGSVAEKRRNWSFFALVRPLTMKLMMLSMISWKPMSSIWSVSSRMMAW